MKRAPLIVAIVLLTLPVFYVASYLALVVPRHYIAYLAFGRVDHYYRFGGDWARRFYWPLEKIDQKLRPEEWEFDLWKQ
jgi:hypothetical protein